MSPHKTSAHEDRLKRAILAARQSVCLAEMIASGKHLFCGRAYAPARELLPNAAKRLWQVPWGPA